MYPSSMLLDSGKALPLRALRSGFMLPAIGLGSWMMGGDTEIDPNADLDREVATLRQGIELGYRHLDTAEIYAKGIAESIIGRAIKGFDRSHLILASKAFRANHAFDDLPRALEGSLKRLGTSFLDLYYLHAPNLEVPLAQTAKALNRAVSEGLIRHIAVANFKPARLDALQAHLDSQIVANQVHLNLVFREPETIGMFDHALERDYFVMAWRPLRLSKRNPDSAATYKNVWERGAYPLLDRAADAHGKSNVQTALNWVLKHPQTVALIKSSNLEHLKEAMGACGWDLTLREFDALTYEFEPRRSVSDTVPLL